jgi:hypothetical protein
VSEGNKHDKRAEVIAKWIIATNPTRRPTQRQVNLVLQAIEGLGWAIDTHGTSQQPLDVQRWPPITFPAVHHDGVSPSTMIGRPATHGRGELHVNRTYKDPNRPFAESLPDGPTPEGTA